MAFADELSQSLDELSRPVVAEDRSGETLEAILETYLLAVEEASDRDILTSILLIASDRKHLLHGAAPTLPKDYCDSIHGLEIGPSAGSCGTAAYTGHAIFVTDLRINSLWDNYRHLAQPHGLRSCWSIPIRSENDEVIGTFAIYHLRPCAPSDEEIAAIKAISGYVARAIATFSETHAV